MAYTPINWSNVNTMQDFLATANTQTAGAFWSGMLYTITIVACIAVLPFGFETLVAPLFGAIVVGSFLLYLGLISTTTLGVLVGLEFLLLLYLAYNNRQQ